jgi:hypothetical protein
MEPAARLTTNIRIYRSAFCDINIGKGRLQNEAVPPVLDLSPNLGQNIHLPLSKKKQTDLEIARFFECALNEPSVAICGNRENGVRAQRLKTVEFIHLVTDGDT